MELVDGDQTVVKGCDAQLFHCEAERCMGADQGLVAAGQKLPHRINFGLGRSRLIASRRIAQVPLRCDVPVPIEAKLAQCLVCKAAADGPLRHHHDGLLQALVVQLVQCDEHQRPGLARGGRRLDQQVLLTALGIGPFLHSAHAQLVGFARCAGACCGDGHRRHRVCVGWVADLITHDAFFRPLVALAAGLFFSAAVILVYSSNSFSRRSVSFLKRRPM